VGLAGRMAGMRGLHLLIRLGWLMWCLGEPWFSSQFAQQQQFAQRGRGGEAGGGEGEAAEGG
jgi:hypothetical protein